tara:strand:+ start:1597 stop:2364 length:768 start_codon:yes stop_codon:yes gene_type:complete
LILLKSKKLSKFKKINHGFFNKNCGVSKGIYKSLNCGIGSKDNKKNIKKNLKIVKNKICKKSKEIFLVKQVHSNKFIFINEKSNITNRSKKVDAIITDKKNFPIAILTADCVPILAYDNKRKMIAAIHSGWKGAYNGIVKKVLKFMFKKGCNSKNTTVAIGPSISKNSYEVQKEFKNKFIKKDRRNTIFFKYSNKKIYFDLPNYVKTQVKLLKIKNIDFLNKDTFIKKNNFFSARQSIKFKHNDYGRNISIIVIN